MAISWARVSGIARRLAFCGVGAIVATTVAASPAQAATNPWTAAEACKEANGGGRWNEVARTDVHYAADNMKIADLYLMHGDGFEKWCGVLIKRADVGKDTSLLITLTVSNKADNKWDEANDTGRLPHYIAVIADDLGGCKYLVGRQDFRINFGDGAIQRGCG